MERAKSRTLTSYAEVHHIVPKSLGGSNLKANKVKLTAREHFLAHWLLWRIHKNRQMAMAFFAMTRKGKGQERILTSTKYEIAKKAMSVSKRGANNYWYGTTGPMGGRPHTEEFKARHKEIMRAASAYKKGKPASEIPGFKAGRSVATQFRTGKPSWNTGLTGEQSHGWGRKHTDETKAKMRNPKPKVTCPHCGLTGGVPSMKRYHFDKCKSFSSMFG